MSSSKPKVRDARFKNRPEPEAKSPPPPRPRGDGGAPKSAKPLPEVVLPAREEVPWGAIIPAVLAIGVAIAGYTLWKDKHPTPSAPADAGVYGTDASTAAPADAATPTPPPTPAADGGGSALSGDPVDPRVENPTSPDPRGGRFSLAQATEGLEGSGALVAEIETSMGTFTCNLLGEEAPNTVANFVGLARGTRDFWDPVAGAWARRPFYDGSVFHRVIPDFMIQGGDVLRSGRGGTGYEFADENVNGHNAAGLLCMANRGPNTNGGQFFITEAPKPHLDSSYSIFGRCTPLDLIGRIARVPTRGERPEQPVFIQHVRIRRAG